MTPPSPKSELSSPTIFKGDWETQLMTSTSGGSMNPRRGSLQTSVSVSKSINVSLQGANPSQILSIVLQQLQEISSEHNLLKESNARDGKLIFELRREGTDKVKWIRDARTVFSFWAGNGYVCNEWLVIKVIRDSLKWARVTGISTGQWPNGGKEISCIKVPSSPNRIVLTITAHQPKLLLLPGSQPSGQNLSTPSHSSSAGQSITCSDTSLYTTLYKHEYATICFGSTAGDSGGSMHDMPINDVYYNAEIRPLLAVGMANESYRAKIIEFFSRYTVSDDVRKSLWKTKIANSLQISLETFENIKQRLGVEGLSKKVDKLIVDDLLRTLPDCRSSNAGQSMYESVRTLLRMWHIYRPDIGYIQGMSYVMCMFFYYFSEFECFVLFSNLVLTREIIHRVYTFDLAYV